MAETAKTPRGDAPALYSVAAISRATGLSEHTLRAWERRHSAITPERSPKGTRRYSEQDLRRLVLLKQAVDSGHRIGALAALDSAELEALIEPSVIAAPGPLGEILDSLGRLDAAEVEQRLTVQFAALGSVNFARYVAQPLLSEIGHRWENGDFSIAAEHLASGIMRSILGVALRTAQASESGARVLLTTPAGERHEFGLLIAALITASAGHHAIYLGPDLPAEETARAATQGPADVVLLAATSLSSDDAAAYCVTLRGLLPTRVRLWIGGPASGSLPTGTGIEIINHFDELETRIADLESSNV